MWNGDWRLMFYKTFIRPHQKRPIFLVALLAICGLIYVAPPIVVVTKYGNNANRDMLLREESFVVQHDAIEISRMLGDSQRRASSGNPLRFAFVSKTAAEFAKQVEKSVHPYENPSCKLPLVHHVEPDILGEDLYQRYRKIDCRREDRDVFTIDSEGYMYIFADYTGRFVKTQNGMKCFAYTLSGCLAGAPRTVEKSDVPVELPINKRFLYNADNFEVRCQFAKNKSEFYSTAVASVRDVDKPQDEVTIVKDSNIVDTFGRVRPGPLQPTGAQLLEAKRKASQPLNIHILGFDSTSRSQWVRHMPLTTETMQQLGFHFVYGYTKVSDNSAVNIIPLLAGAVENARKHPKVDPVNGDINPDHVLPVNETIDPSDIPFLWKKMAEKYGCVTLLNDDIMHTMRGLFHYPEHEFKDGFRDPPTTHYYRPYYVQRYTKWRNKPQVCYDGELVQKQFVDLWKFFQLRNADKCQFGFTFIASLTHDDTSLLESMDEYMRSALQDLAFRDALDRSVMVIMGDHGHRINVIQYQHTGRIEERTPLMAIRLPSWFADKYPKQYAHFLANKWRLTSNYDVHEFLRDIVDQALDEERSPQQMEPEAGRGISLIRPIPVNRSCFDAYISHNHCVCLVDRSNETKPMDNYKGNRTYQEEHSLEAIYNWLASDAPTGCFRNSTLKIVEKTMQLSINHEARHGYRYRRPPPKTPAKGWQPMLEFVYHEFNATLEVDEEFEFRNGTASATTVGIHFRIREHANAYLNNGNKNNSAFIVDFDPYVHTVDEAESDDGAAALSESCSRWKYVEELCECLESKRNRRRRR